MVKYTKEQLAAIVEEEGLYYSIDHYASAEEVEDPELSELWEDTQRNFTRIKEILGIGW